MKPNIKYLSGACYDYNLFGTNQTHEDWPERKGNGEGKN